MLHLIKQCRMFIRLQIDTSSKLALFLSVLYFRTQSYDYQPSEVTYSSQNTHRFKDIPAAYTFQNGERICVYSSDYVLGDILRRSGSPIDARLSNSGRTQTPPPPRPAPTYRDEGELHFRDLPTFSEPPPPRQYYQN